MRPPPSPPPADDPAAGSRWRLGFLLALSLALPLVAALVAASHLWVLVGSLATYRPAQPSRLLGAPLVLRPGAAADGSALAGDLASLDYREVPGPPRQGEYTRQGSLVRIGLRAGQAARELDLDVAGGRIVTLRADGQDLLPGASVDLGRPPLYTYYDAGKRECRPVRLQELPPHVVGAVLAAEDAGFFSHPGLAPAGILRAGWEDLRARQVRQGGSTITQQLVKNLFLGPQRTLDRKLREAALALLVDARFGKQRILEAYLDEIYWGNAGGANLHGIGAAARAYFGKQPAELDLAEAATLAGMIPSPADTSPLTAPAAARERRDGVLRQMAAHGFVSGDAARAAMAEPLSPHPMAVAARRAPWFAIAAASEARSRFGIERLGGKGYTLLSTLSTTDQAIAEQEVSRALPELAATWEQAHRGAPLQASLVSLAPDTGRISAWVGGRDWAQSQFDRVAQARRQVGSTFKPIVYATALRDGRLLPWELLRDSPLLVRSDHTLWRPRDSDGAFRGEVTPADALAFSLNLPTVRVALRAGIDRVAAVARLMGIESPLPRVPALALGAGAVTPLEMALVYSTLANSGRRPAAWGIEGVLDRDDRPVAGQPPPDPQRALPADVAYELTSMLRGVFERGTGVGARSYGLQGPLAGKTGTTDDRRDAWFAGYSRERATVVWVGYDDDGASQLSGSRGALPLWSRFMARVAPPGGYAGIAPPAGFVTVEVDPESGLLATPLCPHSVQLELPAARVPLRSCDLHGGSGQLAWQPERETGGAPETLADLLARGAPQRSPVRLRDEVMRLFGQGNHIEVQRGPAPPSVP